jgi:hypothetical protein
VTATPRLRLKQPSGWFAAGCEVREAAMLLSDSAFKLFMWLCLHAERTSGTICANESDLASTLRKTENQVASLIEELIAAGICRRLERGGIEISDRFWPYERVAADPAADARAYIATVKRLLLQHACVQCAFTPADEKLAEQWRRQAITIEQVDRAILLGTLRKYVALLNRGRGSPITTLHYFTSLIDEARTLETSSDYWRYMKNTLADLEQRWKRGPSQGAPEVSAETK